MDRDGDTAYDTEWSKIGPDLPFYLSQQYLLNNIYRFSWMFSCFYVPKHSQILHSATDSNQSSLKSY